MNARTRSILIWARWFGLFAIASTFFSFVTELPELRVAHGVLVYLLLIVGASREAKRGLAASMVVASYLAVDWFFVPPRRSLGVPTELDLVILVGFFITAAVISRLVVRLRRTADVATARAEEIERLSAERLRLEKEASRADVLREAERLKNALIASITHDLRSPLSSLAMLSDPASGLDREAALRRIASETRRLTDFVSAMRQFAFSESREASSAVVEAHVVDDLLGTAVRSRESVLREHVVSIVLPESDDVMLVCCDFSLTLQILANLLENAAKFSPPATRIELSARARPSCVEIVVADEGPGLSATDVASVFEPLRRGDAGAAIEGSGMGLAIARTFAYAQRGDLQYRARDGGGAEFVLSLPNASLSVAA